MTLIYTAVHVIGGDVGTVHPVGTTDDTVALDFGAAILHLNRPSARRTRDSLTGWLVRTAAPRDPDHHAPHPPTVEITREQVECWAGRALTNDEVDRLDAAIPNSSIPEAIGEIVAALGREHDDG